MAQGPEQWRRCRWSRDHRGHGGPCRRAATLHPGEAFTCYYTVCLRERLAGLEASNVAPAASGLLLYSRPFAGGVALSGSGAATPLQAGADPGYAEWGAPTPFYIFALYRRNFD
jgi:hypothetical protein